MTSIRLVITLVLLLATMMQAPRANAQAPYTGWQHSGSFFILTTPEGANLPASALEKNLPLLVRLHKDFL